MPYGELTFLTGDFGSFKSYMSWFVADAVSQGGIFADRVCAKHPVLILDRENSHSTVSLRRYLVGNLKSNPDVRFLGNFTSPRVCDVDDSRLIEVCKQIRPLIILDSFADFHPGLSESDPDDMVQFTQKLLNLTASGAAGVIALHHIPKAGTGKGKNYRGTTAIPAAGGAAILVEKENKTGVTLSGFKNRDGEELVVRLEMVFRKDNVSYRVLSSGKDEAAILRDAVQRFIHDHPNCGVKEVANGISKRPEDVGETIKEMERTGVLVPRPKIRSGQKIELRCNCSDCQPSKAVPENLERLLIQ